MRLILSLAHELGFRPDRRGCRDRGPARRAAPSRVQDGPRLPVCQADDAGRRAWPSPAAARTDSGSDRHLRSVGSHPETSPNLSANKVGGMGQLQKVSWRTAGYAALGTALAAASVVAVVNSDGVHPTSLTSNARDAVAGRSRQRQCRAGRRVGRTGPGQDHDRDRPRGRSRGAGRRRRVPRRQDRRVRCARSRRPSCSWALLNRWRC